MTEHLSIGEVLAELHGEHPDITISKIRFLESQGLIAPERTPSGYRKFYPDDVTRLRWILHQQKDNFLPLKVIRERLDEQAQPRRSKAAARSGSPKRGAAKGRKSAGKRAKSGTRRKQTDAKPPGPAEEGDSLRLPLDDDVDVEPVTRRSSGRRTALTRRELTRRVGLDDAQLAELESYGLLTPATDGDRVVFDDEGLRVARAAAAFAKHGIEARHLKMYKNFAEREAGMFTQVLLPHLRQRNPDARARAQGELEELAKLGRAMRAVMLRQAVERSLNR